MKDRIKETSTSTDSKKLSLVNYRKEAVFSRVDLCVREPEKRMEGMHQREYPGP